MHNSRFGFLSVVILLLVNNITDSVTDADAYFICWFKTFNWTFDLWLEFGFVNGDGQIVGIGQLLSG